MFSKIALDFPSEVNLNIKQRDVSYRKTETYTIAQMESMTYSELQDEYYEKPTPKEVRLNLIEPMREVTI